MTLDCSVYGILDPARSRGRPLPTLAAAAVRGGVTLLQIRDKTGSTRDQVVQARAVLAAVAGTHVPVLVNDRVDVALAAGADGVHLGEDDMAPEDARRLLGPDAIIGLTIHSIGEADAAPVALASYFGAGGVYGTRSKVNRHGPIGPDGFGAIRAVLKRRAPGIPAVGIAGITAENAGPVMAAGADGVAVISDLFMADDVEAAARRLAAAVRVALEARP
jgi:thiamine-phosphate pyrophosphorylase